MKKLLLLLFSLLLSFNSYGEWKLIHERDIDSGYIDTESITEHNDSIYFSAIQNLNQRDEESQIMSIKGYIQADCGAKRSRILTYYAYSESMGNGQLLEELTPENPEWEYLAPDKISGYYLNFVCSYDDLFQEKAVCTFTDGTIGSDGRTYLKITNQPFTGKDLCKHENGQKQSEVYYKDGRQEGKSYGWYENGQLALEGNFVNGKPDGKATIWYEDGQKMMESNYILGKPEGKITFWGVNGEFKESYWEDGECISGECPNEPKKSKNNTPSVTISIN